MARESTAAIIQRRRREREVAGERFVDLCLDFVDERTGEVLCTVGGRWDRRLKGYNGEADTAVIIRCHAGQRHAVEWFASWIKAHATRRGQPPPPELLALIAAGGDVQVDADPDHVYSALFAGGRRAGKTWIGVALTIAYAVEFPEAETRLIGPEEDDWPEMIRYARGVIADEWAASDTADGWLLANGSTVLLRSAYDPDGLKEGRIDFALLNEGQRCKHRAFIVLRGCVADVGGCVLVCANPPIEAKDQTWVSDMAAEAAVGKRASIYVEFNALANPHIRVDALLSMAHEVDERTFEVEVLGLFRAPKDAVAYNWIRYENERRTPDVGDCTEELLGRLGEGDGLIRVVGIDVQLFPYMAAVEFKFFGRADRDLCLPWVTGELAPEGADELELAGLMEDRGWDPRETLLVVDGTGEYQHSRRRSLEAPPPEWKGRGSFDLFREAGFRRIVTPDRRLRRKNPPIVDRARAFTSLICNRAGVRRLHADPIAAPKTCHAIREWRVVNGKPSRRAEVVHLGDALTYPIIRLFPRRLRSGKPGAVDPVASKVDLSAAAAAAMAGGSIDPRDLPPDERERYLRGRGRPRRWRGI